MASNVVGTGQLHRTERSIHIDVELPPGEFADHIALTRHAHEATVEHSTLVCHCFAVDEEKLLQLMEEIADERCGPSATFEDRTAVVQAVGEEVLRFVARQRAEKEGAG